ncbi:MAG: aminoacyl-histidine dipeptidase [Defluviitaleaceae bacterium]|nr:aminoacyl-histidine dipeptidase [Defluviitaleaceae bacterium]
MSLLSYEPKRVFYYFDAISQIPRGSGNEKSVSDYIAAFAKQLGLKCVQDAYYNLVIYKPGTPGYEGQMPLILQGHLDMVCEKNTGTVHDFESDPLKLYVDGDYLRADGTTLGADNGIAVAMCMALLEAGDIAHPPLEVVLTSDEEAGMGGALNLDFGLFKGRRMINLDSSTEGSFIVGCAAGTIAEYKIPAIWEASGEFTQFYTVNVKGLTGGHSGGDIHLERGNAIRILGNVLSALESTADIRIASVRGGMKVNAIPREAEALVAINPDDISKIHAAFDACVADMSMFFRVADPGLDITLSAAGTGDKVLAAACGEKLIASLILLPSGVLIMSRDIAGLVASSSNIGVIETLTDTIKITCMPRGASNAHNHQTEVKIDALARLTGAEFVFTQRSPAWPLNPESGLLAMFAASYKHKYGKEAKVTAIHAGLECGIFVDNLPGLDIISMGPDIHDLHTPDERLSISSTARVWEFLCEVIGQMK